MHTGWELVMLFYRLFLGVVLGLFCAGFCMISESLRRNKKLCLRRVKWPLRQSPVPPRLFCESTNVTFLPVPLLQCPNKAAPSIH